jgi:hypothetical protein
VHGINGKLITESVEAPQKIILTKMEGGAGDGAQYPKELEIICCIIISCKYRISQAKFGK